MTTAPGSYRRFGTPSRITMDRWTWSECQSRSLYQPMAGSRRLRPSARLHQQAPLYSQPPRPGISFAISRMGWEPHRKLSLGLIPAGSNCTMRMTGSSGWQEQPGPCSAGSSYCSLPAPNMLCCSRTSCLQFPRSTFRPALSLCPQ